VSESVVSVSEEETASLTEWDGCQMVAEDGEFEHGSGGRRQWRRRRRRRRRRRFDGERRCEEDAGVVEAIAFGSREDGARFL